MSSEFVVTICDNRNNKNYAKLIDCVRPQNDNQHAYICITKFQASVATSASTVPNNIIVSLDGAINAHSNDPYSSIVVPSPIIDCFTTVNFQQNDAGFKRAIYNVENNQSNWIKINKSSLYNLKFSFRTCSNYLLGIAGLDEPITYVDIPSFPFMLQFKIKFE
jgi:hypothetical protein